MFKKTMFKKMIFKIKNKTKNKKTRTKEALCKILTTYIAASIIIFIISAASYGCGIISLGQEESAQNEEEVSLEEDTESASRGEAAVKLIVWDCIEPKERIALIESSEKFSGNNNIINVETRHFRNQQELEDQFEAASLAGAGPDIVMMNFDGVQRLAPENVVKEVYEEIDYDIMLDGLAEISRYNNKRYMVPFRASEFLVLYYNKDIIEDLPGSFENIFNYAAEVNNFKENNYGFLFNLKEPDWIIPFIGGYNDWIIDYNTNSLTLDNNAVVKTLELLDFIYNQEKLQPLEMEYNDISEFFKSGNTPMIIDYYDTLKTYREDAGVNIGVSTIPKTFNGYKNPTPLISGIGFMINMNCYGAQLDSSKAFIDYMLSDEVQGQWNLNTDTLPALKDFDQNETFKNDQIMFEAFQQAKICRGKPYDDLLSIIRNVIRDNAASVLAGDLLPDEAALKMQEDAIRLRSGNVEVEIENGSGQEGGPESGQEGGPEDETENGN